MSEGSFNYWDDPLKHYVRLESWLPLCRHRLEKVRQLKFKKNQTRRLRYFTFCATSAIDVLMLDVGGIIRQDTQGRFDNVTFFDYKPENVVETLKRIPGAVGFSGDFIDTVLFIDQDEENDLDDSDVLAPLVDKMNIMETRRNQVIKDQRRRLIQRFPFDVMNFDLEEFLFKPGDPRPGKVVRALKKVFRWQQKPFSIPLSGANQYVDEFSLMFTTQIGPPNINDDYLLMLQNYLQNNLHKFDGLGNILEERFGYTDVVRLRRENFDMFFKLAMPKVLANILMENDWFVDPEKGIEVYEFERPAQDGNYVMLHLAMDVKRKNPPFDRRDPGEDCPEALDAYRDLTFQLFGQDSVNIEESQLDKQHIEESLDYIVRRANKYMSGNYA